MSESCNIKKINNPICESPMICENDNTKIDKKTILHTIN